jgi:hypothetical protein
VSTPVLLELAANAGEAIEPASSATDTAAVKTDKDFIDLLLKTLYLQAIGCGNFF